MVRPHLFRVPTSCRAASCTVSFQSPATGSPANWVRSKLPLMSSAEPPARLDTTADFPDGEVKVTTRSPRYVCEMSRSSLSLSTDAVLSRWMVELMVDRSPILAFGVAFAMIGDGGSARGPTNASGLPAAADGQDAWALRSGSRAGDAAEVAGRCAVMGRAAGSRFIDDPLSPNVRVTFLDV